MRELPPDDYLLPVRAGANLVVPLSPGPLRDPGDPPRPAPPEPTLTQGADPATVRPPVTTHHQSAPDRACRRRRGQARRVGRHRSPTAPNSDPRRRRRAGLRLPRRWPLVSVWRAGGQSVALSAPRRYPALCDISRVIRQSDARRTPAPFRTRGFYASPGHALRLARGQARGGTSRRG